MSATNPFRPSHITIQDRQRWWPVDLGVPATFGSSETLRYASFPLLRRLVIERNGIVVTYDTATHQFRGVLQCGIPDGKMSFLSQHGRIDLTQLRVVS